MRGTYHEIQCHIKKKYDQNKGLVIGEPQFICETIYYSDKKAVFITGAYFATKPTYIFAIINGNENRGECSYFDGLFNHDEIMLNICGAVIESFPESAFREKRRIIMDFGQIVVSLLKKIDDTLNISYNDKDLHSEMHFDKYEVLVDVDWIEVKMNEWYQRQGITNYVMVPFI